MAAVARANSAGDGVDVVLESADGTITTLTAADVRHDAESGAFRVSAPLAAAGGAAAPRTGVVVEMEAADGHVVSRLDDAQLHHDAETGAFCVSGTPAAAAAGSGAAGESKDAMASLLTVVVTTSPARCNPSLEMLERVVASFAVVPGLAGCRVIVVADGCKRGAKHRPSRGIVSEDAADRYDAFLAALESASAGGGSPLRGVDVIRQPGREGFGFAVRRALEDVATPFVMVVHHDQRYRRGFDLPGVVRKMQEMEGRVNYVGVLSPGTIGYENKCVTKGLPSPTPGAFPLDSPDAPAGTRLVPLYVWFDRNHIASCAFYRSNVFASGLVKRGTFIEDCYGQQQLKRIKEGGLEVALIDYGCFFLDDGTGDSMIHHIDGRKWMTAEQRAAAGLPPLAAKD